MRNPSTYYFKDETKDKKYTISLIGISEHNCQDTFKSDILVYPNPQIEFTTSNTQGCGPLSVSFKNNSSPQDTGNIKMMSFNWKVNNSLKSSNVDFSTNFAESKSIDSVYSVKLIGYSEHNCIDSSTKSITVYPKPIADFSMDKNSGCAPLKVNFSNQSNAQGSAKTSNLSYSWNFGNGVSSTQKDVSVTFESGIKKDTIYTVVLTVSSEFGCVGTDTQYVKVYANPEASFTINQKTGCSPFAVMFTNNSLSNNNMALSTMKFMWDFGNGDTSSSINPTAKFTNNSTQIKNYTVKLSAYNSNSCVSSFTQTISIYSKPEVSFYLADTTACHTLNAVFVNTTQSKDPQNIMKYSWNFGNGVYSQAKDTTILYTAASSGEKKYNVVLIGENSYGCVDTFEKQLVIYALPVTDFTFNNKYNCGEKVVFSNLSVSNDNKGMNSMNYIWNYGNQKISQNISDTVTFMQSTSNDTNYSILLKATNAYGCSDTISKSIVVHPRPTISFTVSTNETCSGVDVQFINTSKNLDQYTWHFGDGKSSNSKNPKYAYINNSPNAFLYNSYLIGTSADGCKGDTFKQNILIHPVQSADIISSSDSGCAPLATSFYNNSRNSSSFQWFVSNKLTSTSTNFNYTFAGSPNRDTNYQVMLVSKNDIGCTDTAYRTVKVFQQVIAGFSVSSTSGCSPAAVSFTNQSTGANAYFWNLGNGQTTTETNTTATYSNFFFQDINYEITLFAISKHNCFDTIKKTVTVHPIPLASFTADKLQGCDPVIVNFTNQSIIADSYLWDFGNGVTSALQQPAQVFSASANDKIYNVRLTVTTKYGCSNSFNKEIRVYSSPKALFNTSDSGCAPVITTFKDMSKNATFWNWEFGDGFTSSEKNPVHIYSQAGEYSVKLRVSNYLGCSDTFVMYRNIKVWAVPTAQFTADKYYSEYPDVTFTFNSLSPSGLVYQWTFGNDRVVKNTNSVSYSFKDTGTYFVRLVVSTPHCNDTSLKVVIVKPPFPKSDFIYNKTQGCGPLKVSFTDKSLMADKWLWYFGDGEYSAEQHPQHTYKNPGLYSVTLISSNSRGSHSVYKKDIIIVHPKPNVYFEVSPSPAWLPKAKVDLVNLTVNGNHYKWFIDNEFIDTLQHTSRIFEKAGTHDVMLIAISKYGCTDTLIKYQAIKIDTMGSIYMPNAFTPNNDGRNDIFTPVGFGYKEDGFNLRIFTRWGELIYETDNFEKGWDGTSKGELCMEGIYVYRITIQMVNNEVRNLEGSVHLLR